MGARADGQHDLSGGATPDRVARRRPSRTIFGVSRDSSGSFRGLVGEIVIVTSALSTTDRQKLEGYLAWKWGTASTLPAGHPYRSVPPTV